MFAFQIPKLPEWMILRNDVALAEPMFRGMAIRPGTFTDEDITEFKAALKKPGAATAAVNYYRAAFRSFSLMRRLEKTERKVSAPTLLIWAEDDVALGKELTYGMEPLIAAPFRIHYVPNCSHWVNEEQPELVNRLLLEFLEGRSAA